MSEDALWKYARELHAAVEKGNQGVAPQPFRKGTYLVAARAGDIEVTIKDVAEEDAVLITGELRSYGIHAVIRGSLVCPHCNARVPSQRHCALCRKRLPHPTQPMEE